MYWAPEMTQKKEIFQHGIRAKLALIPDKHINGRRKQRVLRKRRNEEDSFTI